MGGGTNNNVSQLFSYIAKSPFLHLKSVESKNLPSISEHYAGASVQRPVANPFAGDVAILVSGNTASAASEFTAIAHFQKRAVIIGEEVGGCYYGATGGNYVNLTLPNSRLGARIPTIKILTAVDEDFNNQPKGRGAFPDQEVVPTITDILKGRDVQLETAIARWQ